MSKCRCGCGGDVEEGKVFLKGHWSKLNAKQKEEKTKPEEPKQPEIPKITISDVQPYNSKSGNVAWFKTETDYIWKEPEFYCTVINETAKEQGSYVAVVLEDGSILPVVMIPGFMGLFPEDHEFIEPEEPKPEEKEQIPEENPIVKILPPQEKPPITQPASPINDTAEVVSKRIETIRAELQKQPEPKKKEGLLGSFVRKIYTKKEKPAIRLNEHTELLLKRLKDATG